MDSYRDHVVATMPLTYADPGASGGWKASGALAPMAPPVHEGIFVPVAGDAVTPSARRDRRSLAQMNPSTNDVPGTRTWSPPA